MNLHTFRHCEERIIAGHISRQLVVSSLMTSDAAISLHNLTGESYSKVTKTLHSKVRAGRLPRGCSNDALSSCLVHAQLKLAMTNVAVMI
jgi:hypothetical protein